MHSSECTSLVVHEPSGTRMETSWRRTSTGEPARLRRRRLLASCCALTGGTVAVAICAQAAVRKGAGQPAAGTDTSFTSFLQLGDYREPDPKATVLVAAQSATELPDVLLADKSCEWRRADTSGRRFCQDGSCSGTAVAANVCHRDDENATFATCGFDYQTSRFYSDDGSHVFLCDHDNVRTMLIGPFSSHVQQWTSIVAPVTQLKRGDRIVSFSGDAVDAADALTPVGYPPLHMHHIHVQREEPHFWETHGDYDM
eukprot:7386744-Prymnesium_polylepis.1